LLCKLGGVGMISVTDFRIDKKALESLFEYGFKNIPLKPWPALSQSVSAHPDMLLFILDHTLLTHIDYYQYNKTAIDTIASEANLKLLTTDEKVASEYPNDVLFNAAVVGKYLIANLNFVSKKVIELCEKKGLIPIHIKQGYAKCSICVVSEGAVITSDEGICETLNKETELDVLKIEKGHIDLCQYEYGFIGGASGAFENSVFFCGNLSLHPDGEKIIAFCNAHGKTAISLTDKPLADVGTIFCFK